MGGQTSEDFVRITFQSSRVYGLRDKDAQNVGERLSLKNAQV